MLSAACQIHQPVYLVQETAPKFASGIQGHAAKRAGSRAAWRTAAYAALARHLQL